MNSYQASLHLLIFLTLITTSIASPIYSRIGCNDTCGIVRIPYPFGIGADCSVNPWYIVECTSSKPYLSALNHLELLDVNLENQTVTVKTPTISYCLNPYWVSNKRMSIDLGRSPFLFSKSHNKFVFEGCGNAVMMDNGSVVTGCSTYCRKGSFEEEHKCYGINCCETTIPHYLKSYVMNLTGLHGTGDCGYGFLVDENSYLRGRFSVAAKKASVPISLTWILTSSDIQDCCQGTGSPFNLELNMGDGTSVHTQKCFPGLRYVGNPYLSYGCEVREECARCPYNCYYDTIYEDDGSSRLTNFTCTPTYPMSSENKSSIAMGNILSRSLSS
ncbi:putative wall-associated receptor kinase, galacturonan-binding domain-containing protein [Helianthus annuus]|nr:putative wall-associated receptor kinase, galacturonan-binding domain-containing protein [Helianthus annuus]KAJ0660284.1 putative wall-associated receptor kinase, galacturonan-binding domain-containing protein [Helianthus annuus]KAJ0840794.1 putative wall-associated receptor kinase, galacturonan-binding domain-containing protein [Helianthus annuus]KAJ0854211.1 putative wall-associated receptor kinase, galacturonan-binding domain-containing protein [Helianthus annuus]